jgi:MATE family multidrug resistance protein
MPPKRGSPGPRRALGGKGAVSPSPPSSPPSQVVESDDEEEVEDEREGLLGLYGQDDSSADVSIGSSYQPGSIRSEMRVLFPIAWQTVLATVLQSMTQQVTVLFVGHIGVVELGAAALASMWVNITGVSIVYGGASALDSLASQAYGAKSYTAVGLWSLRFLLIVTIMCVPICCSWWFGCAPVLRLIGIDEETAIKSELFCRVYTLWMWPTFANRAMQSFLRAQGIVRPVSIVTTVTLAVHIPTTYVFVEWLGFAGAPLALAINAWMSFFLLLAYCRTNVKTKRCLPDVCDSQVLEGWGLLIRMGAAGAAAMMGVWWSWELLSGMAGTLGEVPLAAHVAMQQFGMFFFPFFLGGGMAATARVGNLLGMGDPKRARISARAATIGTVVVQGTILSPVLIARHKFAYIYTNDVRVAELAAQVAWFFVLNQFITANSVVLQGILTGCGRQAINAKVALMASYCVGIPCALLFGFYFQFGVLGLWGGLACGQLSRASTLHFLCHTQDWAELSRQARARANVQGKRKDTAAA